MPWLSVRGPFSWTAIMIPLHREETRLNNLVSREWPLVTSAACSQDPIYHALNGQLAGGVGAKDGWAWVSLTARQAMPSAISITKLFFVLLRIHVSPLFLLLQ